MSIELVKAELQVFANFTDDCRSFHSFVANLRMIEVYSMQQQVM